MSASLSANLSVAFQVFKIWQVFYYVVCPSHLAIFFYYIKYQDYMFQILVGIVVWKKSMHECVGHQSPLPVVVLLGVGITQL